MINILIKIIKIKLQNKKKLVENFIFLSLLQASSYLLPFLTIPYLIRVIGIEKYGLVAFAQAISAYLILFTDYGFNLTATKSISINRNNHIELNNIFSSVVYIKLLLLLSVSMLYFSMIFLIPKFSTEFNFFAISFGMVVGNTFFPVWFFQGMERMRYSSILTIGAKLFFTVLIFVFVKTQSDYILVPLFNSLGFLVSGILSFILIHKSFNVKFVKVSGSSLISEFKAGWHVFLSTISISFYRNINIVIMGFFAPGVLLGYYSVAEKLIKAIQSFIMPFSNVLFPHMSNKMANQSVGESIRIINKIRNYYICCLSIVSLCVFFLADILSILFIGNIESLFVINIKILSFVILFGNVNFLLGVIGLINLGLSKSFSLYIGISGFLNLALIFLFIKYRPAYICSIGLLAAELFLFALCLNKINKVYKH